MSTARAQRAASRAARSAQSRSPIKLSVSQRLTNGWNDIHNEMSVHARTVDTCYFHGCSTQNCNCYRKFPSFLLRRVNSNWTPVNGTIVPSAMLWLAKEQCEEEEYWDDMEWKQLLQDEPARSVRTGWCQCRYCQ